MKRFRTIFLGMVLLSVFLLIGQPLYAAGEPGQCPGGSLPVPVGPPIFGDLVLAETIDVNSGAPATLAIFRGDCRHHLDVTLGRVLFGGLENVNAPQDLIGFILPQSGFPGCYSQAGGEDITITKVTDFWKVIDPLSQVTYLTADIKVATLGCAVSKPKK
jgi:hypothetical protein